MVFLQRKNLGATALKLGMHIQLYSGGNNGRARPFLFLILCKAKNDKNGISGKILDLRS